MKVMEAIVYPFLVANILFYVYETDFFVQYVKLFRLNKLLGVDNYESYLAEHPGDTYWEYLAYEKPNFLTKLISCPLCSGFWLNVGIYFLYEDLGLFMLCLWLSIFLFLILRLILKRAYHHGV